MTKLFPHMSDSPERSQVMGGLSYGGVAFVVLPFTFTLFLFQRNPDEILLFLEFLYQILNFSMMLAIFRSYLQDSWLNVSLDFKKVMGVSVTAAAMIAGLYLLYAAAGAAELFESADLVFVGSLPMTGIELMMLPGEFVSLGGLPAMVVLVVLGPVTASCLFYATAFAPVCVSGKRWQAYLSVSALLAVPRIITACTVWGGWKELPLYLAQLPIHWIACWSYQKTNTIWAPIFAHALVNMISCCVLVVMRSAGFFG